MATAPAPEWQPIESMMVLSTAHITEDTCNRWLNEEAGPAYRKGEYGWFIYAHWTESTSAMPVDLAACLEFARAKGCGWVMFDCDASSVEELPEYGW